ncbi:MAG: hypothetical protein IKQ71_09760 [Lachnospiraceae bacterium]|nr:hypothetical protein [Lachnospiraceae bacterium]
MMNKKIIRHLLLAFVMLCAIIFSNADVRAENGATSIALNTPVAGSVSQTQKSNWYSFKPTARGYFNISFKSTDITKDIKCYIRLYNSSRDVMIATGSVNSLNSSLVSCVKGEIFYIEVEVDRTFYGDYELCVNQVENNKWEIEHNDTTSKATSLPNKTKISGVICNSKTSTDVDYYKMVLKKNCKITVDFGPRDITKVGELTASLVNSKGTEVTIVSNSKMINKKILCLKKGTYYIKVKNGYGGAYVPYTIKYTSKNIASVKKATLKSASISADWLGGRYLREIKLKKNIKKVETYEVKVSSKKNMKGSLFTTTAEPGKVITKFKSTGLANQADFYIQIRPCVVDAFGNKIYNGKKSNVIKATIIK